MDYRDWIDRRIPPLKWMFAIVVASTLLFGGSYFVDITFIVESPAIGDITGEVGLAWRIFSGGITLLASVVTIREYLNDKDDEDETGQSQGPAKNVIISGDNHDINLDVVIPDRLHGDRFAETPANEPKKNSEREQSTDEEELEEEN